MDVRRDRESPLTGFIGDSLSSSFLATELKKTSGDALIIVGRAETPTLLFIEDGVPRFLAAADLMGLGTFDTEQAVKERLGRISSESLPVRDGDSLLILPNQAGG